MTSRKAISRSLSKSIPVMRRDSEVCYLLGKTLFHEKKLRESNSSLSQNPQWKQELWIHRSHALLGWQKSKSAWATTKKRESLLSSIAKRFPKFDRIDYTYYCWDSRFSIQQLPPSWGSFKKRFPLSSRTMISSSFSFLAGPLSLDRKTTEATVRYLKTFGRS